MQGNTVAVTKHSDLVRLRGALEKCGFVIPNMQLVRCSIYDREQLMNENALFLKGNSPNLPSVTVIRNNGTSRGAGIGTTSFLLNDADPSTVSFCYYDVMGSDKSADGAIFQQFAGSEMALGKKKYFAPIISGIAYTGPCTRTGNAVLQWVYGHPKSAVEGKGNYFAFNSPEVSFPDNVKYPIVYALERHDEHKYLKPLFIIAEHEQFMQENWYPAREVFRKIAASVHELGKYGAYYLEWAGDVFSNEVRRFALQVHEVVDAKLPGLDNATQSALDKFSGNLGNALTGLTEYVGKNEITGDHKRLQELYEQAIYDPNVIAVGFDVVGNKRQRHASMLITDEENLFSHYKHDISLSLINPESIYINEKLVKQWFRDVPQEITSSIGIVEMGTSPHRVKPEQGGHWNFRAHMHGFFKEKGILGLSGTHFMPEKLNKLMPENASNEKMMNIILNGEFILDIDESMPIGTLRIEKIDSFERVKP